MPLPKELLEYVHTYVPVAGVKAVKEALLKEGWKEEAINQAIALLSVDEMIAAEDVRQKTSAPIVPPKQESNGTKKKRSLLKTISLLGLALLFIAVFGSIGYTYFVIIDPTFVPEPDVGDSMDLGFDPFLENVSVANQQILEDQLEYLAVKLNAYKLHNVPGSDDPPVIEYTVSDTAEMFTITIIDNTPKIEKRQAPRADIRVSGTKRTFFQLLSESDIPGAVKRYMDENKLTIDVLIDEETLALKGYKAVLDGLS